MSLWMNNRCEEANYHVLFSIEPDSETESEVIILLDVGTHDNIY